MNTQNRLPAVVLTGVTKRFGDFTAVKPLDLEIRDNEFFSILGPSGCGKTTLMRMITGLETPTSGLIELNGEDVTQVPTRKRDLNMLFQSYALFPHLTVFDNAVFELRVRKVEKKEADRRAMQALELVKLDHLATRKPDELSGGQRQRVALARAVVSNPKVVLLDEPLGALDQKLRKEMQFELKRMQREVGITFIYVTHDQGEALTMSDRIAVMSEGQIEQVGTPEEIYNRPTTKFTGGFIGNCNLFDVTAPTGTGGQTVSVEINDQLGVAATLADDVTHAQDATLLVRPERINVTKTEGDYDATLTAATFLGNEWQLELDLGDKPILASVTSLYFDQELRGIEPGDRVRLSWAAEDARVVIA